MPIRTAFDLTQGAPLDPTNIRNPDVQQQNIREISARNPGQVFSSPVPAVNAPDGTPRSYQAYTPTGNENVTGIPGRSVSSAPNFRPASDSMPTRSQYGSDEAYLGAYRAYQAAGAGNQSLAPTAAQIAQARAQGITDPNAIAGFLNRSGGTNFNGSQVQEGGAPSAGGYTGAPGSFSAPSSVLSREEYQAQFGAAPVDENAIREQRRREAQAEIDAIDAVYNTMVSDRRVVNEGNLGSTRASDARGGNLGGDFGNANMSRQRDLNENAIKAINAERGVKIQSIFADINKSVKDEVAAKKAEALGQADSYKNYLSDAQTKARAAAASLGSSGLSFDELKSQQPEVLNTLLKNTGYDEFTLATIMNNNKKAAEKINYTYKTVGNKVIGYGLNPKTGEIESIEKTIPGLGDKELGEYSPTTLPDGTLIFTPKVIDPSKPLKDQVLIYGNEEQFGKEQNLPVSAQEYEYAKKNGYTGSFQDYQNEDANRRASASSTPSSYREWELAGKPGTYADWLDRKNPSLPAGFASATQAGINELQTGSPWGAVWSRIKTLYPNMDDQMIDNALGPQWKEQGAYQRYAAEQQRFRGTSTTSDDELLDALAKRYQ